MPYSSLPRSSSGSPKKRRPRLAKIIILIIVAGVLIYAGAWFLIGRKENGSNSKNADQSISFDKTQHSLDGPTSPWVVVNKKRPLSPIDYAPAGLITPNVPLKYDEGNDESKLSLETAQALEEMFEAAKSDGVELIFVSGYRSYSYQEHLFNYFVGLQGEEVALQQSAKPGHSEHQTGWAADVGALNRECEIEICFGDTAEGKWVAEHAHEFGFVIRYPQGATNITGFDYEPWHLRYVGKDLAAELKRTGIQTLEEFFGLPPAPGY